MLEKFLNEEDIFTVPTFEIQKRKAAIDPEIVFQVPNAYDKKFIINDDTKRTLNFIMKRGLGFQAITLKNEIKIFKPQKLHGDFIVTLKDFKLNKENYFVPIFIVVNHR